MPKPESRWARELRVLVEFWLLPLLVAALPYRMGLALARRLAARLRLYDALTEAAWQAYRSLRTGDEREWKADFRLTHLLDHADLFWSLTRRDRWIFGRMALPPFARPASCGLMVVGYHYGQGLWLLRWLRAAGAPARFLSVRFGRADFDTRLRYAYARLRMYAVRRAAGVPPIYTGGSRRVIGDELAGGGCVYGLVDVAVEGAAKLRANGRLLGHPIHLPEGLLDTAREANVPVLVMTSRHDASATRSVDVRLFDSARDLATSDLGDELQQRLDAAPWAWHVWGLWPQFLARESDEDVF